MLFEQVCKIIAEQFAVEPETITMETSFAEDLGADSLDIVELSMALEEEFDLGELEDKEVAGLNTVGDLMRLLSGKLD
jgi:acyl carrier protein